MKNEIKEILRKGKIKDGISLFLKWEVIDNEIRNKLILLSSMYNSSYNDYSFGLKKQEDHKIESNKIVLTLLNLVDEIERRYLGIATKNLPKSVLVAGTGTDEVTDQEILIAKLVGRYLARNGYILISGGWRGVDYAVTTEFADTIDKIEGENLFRRLFQIIPKHKEPLLDTGNVFYVKKGKDEWTKCLNLADYVYLIGGVNGVFVTYVISRQERIPVFPFFDTGRDTTRIYEELNKDWPLDIYGAITKDEFFKKLSASAKKESEIESILDDIKSLTEKM